MSASSSPSFALDDHQRFREQLDQWIADNWDPTITLRSWWQRLADAGLTVPTWPRTLGGLGSVASLQAVIEDQLAGAGVIAPPLADDGIRVVGPALREHGTPQQISRFVPSLLNGSEAWAILLDERVDDDLAEIASTAAIDWKTVSLDGLKLCTRPVAHAQHALTLFRSDPASTGRVGLTCFITDLTDPAVTYPSFNTVSFSHVRLSVDSALGAVGNGWNVAKTVLPYLNRSLAGRIRRGMVHVTPGERAGNLDRTVGDLVIERARMTDANVVDRRAPRD